MQGNNNLCLLVATLALGYACARAEGMRTCRRGVTWWDRERGACAPCTRCDPDLRLAVMYPCELHRDTVCQPLFQIQLFPFNTQNRTKNSNSDYEDEYDYDSEVTNESEDRWDFQAPSVAIAASGCVVFFLVVFYFSLSHAKQWKVLKHTLQSGEFITSINSVTITINYYISTTLQLHAQSNKKSFFYVTKQTGNIMPFIEIIHNSYTLLRSAEYNFVWQ